MQMKDHTLVYAALSVFLIVVIIAAVMIAIAKDKDDVETRKIRVAAVILTGIMTLLVFTSVLYFVQDETAGKEIFDKTFTAMFTVVGTIIGYLFGSVRNRTGASGGSGVGAPPGPSGAPASSQVAVTSAAPETTASDKP